MNRLHTFCDPPHATEALATLQPAVAIESVTPLRKNETMTATALAYPPAFDTTLDLFDDGDGIDGFPHARPQLRLIQGGAHDRILSVPPLGPSASVEVYRRRRFLALVAITAMVLAIAWAAGVSVTSFSGESSGATAQVSSQTDIPVVHVVLPGDSYAAIASNLGAGNAVAGGEQLRIANGGAELVVGQRLVVDVAALSAAG